MKDDLRSVLNLLEFIDEVFPSMGYFSANSKFLPSNVVVVGVSKESVEELIKPKCETLSDKCDIKFLVNYEEASEPVDKTHENDSVYNPTRYRRHNQYDCCYIFFRDRLQILSMWLEAQTKPDTLPLNQIIDKLRKDVYPLVMGGK